MAEAAGSLPRTLRPAIHEALADTLVVCIAGPRQSGKTTLARELEPERPFFTLDDARLYRTAQLDPDGFIAGLSEFVTIDAVQRAPNLLRAIKLSVDRERRFGRFVLTESANPLLVPTLTESLAGRTQIAVLHPLTEAEKERQPGGFLAALLAGELGSRNRAAALPDHRPLVERVVQGGYPEPLTRSPARARQWHRDYLNHLLQRDVREVSRVRRSADLARLLELLAGRTATLLNVNGLANALAISRETVSHYLEVLERMFLIRRLPPWNRSASKRFVRAPKVHLTDSGLAVTLAERTSADWLLDRAAMGSLLESFVGQQLVAQAAWTDPSLRFWHYRDRDQNEVDLVITRGRETWGVEVKASMAVEPRDARSLRRLAAICGDDFRGGIVLHAGDGRWPLGDPRIHSVGIRELWERLQGDGGCP